MNNADRNEKTIKNIAQKWGIVSKGLTRGFAERMIPGVLILLAANTAVTAYLVVRYPGEIIYIAAASLALFFIFVLFFAAVTGRRKKELRELARAADRLAAGDIRDSWPKVSSREIAIVMAALDSVQDKLVWFKSEFARLRDCSSYADIAADIDTEGLQGIYYGIAERANAYIGSLTAYMDVLGVPVFSMDMDFNLIYVNKDAANLLGIADGKSIRGKKCYDYFKCDKCKTEQCIWKRAVEERKILKGETVSTYGGMKYDIQQTGVAIMDFEDGYRITGGLEIITDVTEIHRLKNEANRRAEETERQMQIMQKQTEFQTNYLNCFTTALENMANGNLDVHPEHLDYDEDTKHIYESFKKLGDVLEGTAATIKGYIEELSVALEMIAEKKLNAGISREYVGDFIALKNSIQIILNNLNDIFKQMNGRMFHIEDEASQVASASQSLAQGATEQLAAVEKITVTINDLTQKTKQNVESAEHARHLSNRAKSDAQVGSHQMDEMLVAMDEIKKASSGIANIIKSIEDIAFQTNILALNAAVEAARAGEHGKGFAVVAEEVRALAARSAESAKETTDLIENTVVKVENGVGIANETAQALQKIVGGISDTVEIVTMIADESKEQVSAIAQIEGGMTQIGQVSQMNTSTSEETAASSEELFAQSKVMKDMIGEFDLQGEA